MNIALYSDNFYPEISGVADSISELASGLSARGHSIAFFVPQYTKKNFASVNRPYEEVHLGERVRVIRFSSFPFKTGTGQGRFVIPTGLRVAAARQFNPDVIHSQFPFGVGIEALIAARVLKKPLIGTNHTPISEFVHLSPIRPPGFERLLLTFNSWYYNQCAFTTSPTQLILDEMKTYGFSGHCRPLSNPIDTTFFHPIREKKTLKKKFGFSDFTVVYAGRLAPEKKIDVVMRGVALAKDRIPNITLGIMGKGSAEGELRQLASHLGIESNVQFLGFMKTKEEMRDAYNASEVFAMMSTAETQGLVCMNAMLCDVPVIGARAWGLKEYITKENGYLVEPHDEKALAEKLIYLYTHPVARKRLGTSAHASVQKFSTPHITEEWERIYRNAIEAYNRKDENKRGNTGI